MNSRALFVLAPLAVAVSGCPTAPKPDPLPPAPKVVAFTATPATVQPGAPTTLAWDVTDATKVSIAELQAGPLSGVDGLQGSVLVTPASSALYVLTAVNARGVKASAVATVTVAGQEALPAFAAYPPVLQDGEAGLLVWSAPGAQSVSIAPMGGAPLDLAGQVEAGQVQVSPTATETTYVLTADGATREATVRRAPVVDEAQLSASVAKVGEQVTVSWKTRHGAAVALSLPGKGELFRTTTAGEVAMGSFAWTVPDVRDGTVLSLEFSVEGPGGAARRTLALVVGDGPVVVALNAPEYPRLGGDFSIDWRTRNADVVELRDGALVTWQSSGAAQAQQGSLLLPTPAATKTYTLVARRAGLEATKDFTVYPVGPVQVLSFTAAPTSVASGGDVVTLSWNAPFARRVRIEQDDALTVAWRTGPGAETGTATVYPNRGVTTFRLTADNTLDAPVTASVSVTVGSTVALEGVDGGLVFQSPGTAALDWRVGQRLHGLAFPLVDTLTTSAGFDDISATGEELTVTTSDNGYAQFSVPGFETFLFGRRFAADGQVNVSVNGLLCLKTDVVSTTVPPTPFPSTGTDYYARVLAPFFADLVMGATGRIFWQVKGDAPNRTLIVQWDRLAMLGVAGSELTFQAQVMQSGEMRFEYKTLKNLPATSFPLLIGVQGDFGEGLEVARTPPAEGSAIYLFGPRDRPYLTAPGPYVPFSSFIEVGQGLMPAQVGRVLRPGDVHISEVMFQPNAAVPAGEWFEVANNSNVPVDLRGWVIDVDGGTHTIASSVPVPAGGVAVLGQTATQAQNDGVAVDYAYGAGLVMPDVQGALTLRGPGPVLTVAWDAGVEGVATVFDPTPVITSDAGSTLGPMPCPAVQTYGAQAPLQRGSPGDYHSCRGYVLQVIDGAYEDISTTGTRFNLTATSPALPERSGYATFDATSAPVSLFGTTYTQLTVTTNGFLLPYAYSSVAIPINQSRPGGFSPLGLIAPMWTDFDFFGRPNAGVFYQRFAAGQSTVDPRAHWIVQWTDMSQEYETSFHDHINAQVKFFDSGDIEYHYGTLVSGTARGFATGVLSIVWLERGLTGEALTYSIKKPKLRSDTAVRYRRVLP